MSIKEWINKLRKKKEDLESHKPVESIPEVPKKEIEIKETKINDHIYKMVVSDYISETEFEDRIKEFDTYGIVDHIYFNVFWNNKKQMRNKGTFYVIPFETGFYNILYLDNEIIIGERKRIEISEEEKINIAKSQGYKDFASIENYSIQRRTIYFTPDNNEYTFSTMKLLAGGSSYDILSYKSKIPSGYEAFYKLKPEVTYTNISDILDGLSLIEGIDAVIDIPFLKRQILDDLSQKNNIKQHN